MALGLANVVSPSGVIIDGINTQPDDLHIATVELGLDASHVAEFGGAYGREILRVREENGPRVPEPLVKADSPLGRLSLKVRGCVANLKCHILLLLRFKAHQ